MNDRVDEAKAILQRLHSTSKDGTEDEYALAEFYQIQKQVVIDRTLGSSWMHMFKKPSYRKRALLAIGTTGIIQCSGVLVINSESFNNIIYRTQMLTQRRLRPNTLQESRKLPLVLQSNLCSLKFRASARSNNFYTLPDGLPSPSASTLWQFLSLISSPETNTWLAPFSAVWPPSSSKQPWWQISFPPITTVHYKQPWLCYISSRSSMVLVVMVSPPLPLLLLTEDDVR